ncbi:MAG: prepilin-type N-terminal cleavage/methylation domain-containing protein [Candidatus Omnitrophota bacterium]|jgi:type IV pilus assembly protein PilE
MRKGFTLLELIIVIIIIGVLATLGFVQYSAVIEKARGAEARAVISTLRSQLAAKSMGGETAINSTALGIGAGIPSSCAATNFFSYSIDTSCSTTTCTFIATRCTSAGKTPNGSTSGTLTLSWTSGGTDTWATNAGY